MRNTIRLCAVAVALLGIATACSTPKIMINEHFLGDDKVAKASIKPSGTVGQGDDAITLTNYYIQVCDVVAGRTSNCRTNLILENITDYQVRPTF